MSRGGIRAIIELTVLKLLEERIGFGIPIREFFDLMVGTRYVPDIMLVKCYDVA